MKVTLDLTAGEMYALCNIFSMRDHYSEITDIQGTTELDNAGDKICNACMPHLTNEQRQNIQACHSIMNKVMTTPSVERGAYMGGVQGLMRDAKELADKMNNKKKGNG